MCSKQECHHSLRQQQFLQYYTENEQQLHQTSKPTNTRFILKTQEIMPPFSVSRVSTNVLFGENNWPNLRSCKWLRSCCEEADSVCIA